MIFYLTCFLFLQSFLINEALRISKVKQINEEYEIKFLAALPESNALACVLDNPNLGIRIWGISNTSLIRSIATNSYVISLLGLPNGRIAASSIDSSINIWNYFNGMLITRILDSDVYISHLSLLQNGNILCTWNQELRIFDPNDGKMVDSVWADESISAIVYLQKGYIAISSYNNYNIKLWNSTNLKFVNSLPGHTSIVDKMIELKSGDLLSFSQDLTFTTWDPVKGAEVKSFSSKSDWPSSIVAFKNNPYFAVGSNNGTLSLWNPVNGVLESQTIIHAKSINALVILDNGNLASGSSDNTIKIWKTIYI